LQLLLQGKHTADAHARPLLSQSVTMSEHGSLLSLLMLYPFYEGLMKLLRVSDIHALSMTSKMMFLILARHLRGARDVESFLKRFVDEPRRLREVLRQHDAVIFGDFAFRFFTDCLRESERLDILFVNQRGEENGDRVVSLFDYLRVDEGYTFHSIWEWENVIVSFVLNGFIQTNLASAKRTRMSRD
jgi:hypothetical protein